MRRLTDDEMAEIWRHMDDPSWVASDYAREIGVDQSLINHHRRRMREQGWSSRIYWVPCSVCGELAIQRSPGIKTAAHPACRIARTRRNLKAKQDRRKERGITSTEDVRRWREQNPDRNREFRRKDLERVKAKFKTLPDEQRNEIIDKLHAYDSEQQAATQKDANNHGSLWTADEDAIVIERINDPASDVARQLGRTMWSVRGRRVTLRKRGLIDD